MNEAKLVSERMRHLLLAMSETIGEEKIVGADWLRANNVSIYELSDLMSLASTAIMGFAKMPSEGTQLITSVAWGVPFREALVNTNVFVARQKARKLRKVKDIKNQGNNN